MLNIKKINTYKSVVYNDYRQYDSNNCHTGGAYAFFTTFKNIGGGKWVVSYDTTAEFPFCPVCGIFGEHDCSDYDIVTTEELQKEISAKPDTDDEYLTYE